jgi:hypothetical protein
VNPGRISFGIDDCNLAATIVAKRLDSVEELPTSAVRDFKALFQTGITLTFAMRLANA